MSLARRFEAGRVKTLPWEMLEHIYSYCDPATLAVLARVSFGSWEMASPILYEHIELRSLDGVKSLFYLKGAPLTARLNPSVTLLSRIKTLTIDITAGHQKREPRFEKPRGSGNGCSTCTVFYAHRINRSLIPPGLDNDFTPLPIPKLVWITSPSSVRYFALLCNHLFRQLNPTVMEHRFPPSDGPNRKGGVATVSPAYMEPSYAGGTHHYFLGTWTALRRVVWAGPLLVDKSTRPSGMYQGSAIYTARNLWPKPDERRPLEVVFDLADIERRTNGWRAYEMGLGKMLELGGVQRDGLKRMEAKARILVSEKEAGPLATEMGKLEQWVRDLVVIEVV